MGESNEIIKLVGKKEEMPAGMLEGENMCNKNKLKTPKPQIKNIDL